MARSQLIAPVAFLALAALASCSSSKSSTAGTGASTSTTSSTTTSPGTGGTGTTTAGTGGAGTTTTTTTTTAGTGGGTAGPPSAADLTKLTKTCAQVSNGFYKAKDDSSSATVAICKLTGAFFWVADMDVDCDGKMTTQCNKTADPDYQDETSTTDSMGDPLDAASLPYVVIPLPDSKFSYKAQGIKLGDVVAVIYNGQVAYGVFGDEGPTDIIGEASYAMAKSLGIDPDPKTGGADCCGVTYIVFPGSGAVVSPIEDHAKATALGQQLAATLIQNN